MSKYPVGLVSEVLPLPASVDQSELNDNGLFVVQGLDLSLAKQLIERSKEKHVDRYCPNDAPKRFTNLKAVEAWQAKGRLSMPLVSKLGNGALRLQGFGWMGPGVPGEDEPPIPGSITTYAQRIYEDHVGQGNGTPYAKAMLDTHDALYGNEGVWLEAWVKNIAATSTYSNAGFQHFVTVSGELRGEPMDRVYMTLYDAETS
jgi:hypothetical protein